MFFKWLFKLLINISAFCLLVTFIPGIPPHVSFKEFSVEKPRRLEAGLANNTYLNGAQHLFKGEVYGPEAFASFDGAVYTGVHGGYVVRIDDKSITPIVKFGEPCDDLIEEHVCGRPLGMKFDKHGNLYVADAYYGIFKYNLKKGESTLLVSPDKEIEGKKSVFVNDVAVADDGTVYFTVSSTTFPLYDGIHALLAYGDSRVIKFDPQSGKSTVLVEGLLFANGIAVSKNDEFLVIVESTGLRVMRYYLKGSKKNTIEVFAESLPGVPDNIRSDGGDGYYVSIVMVGDETRPLLPQVLAGFPNIRKFLSRLLYLIELPFVQMDKLYPNIFCKRAAHSVGHFTATKFMGPTDAIIVQLDSNGKIKDALIANDGSVSHVSDMIVLEDDILLGSPYNNFIGRVRRPSSQPRVHIKSVRYEEATDSKKSHQAAEEERKNQIAAKKAAERAAEEAKVKKVAEEAAARAAEEAKALKATEEAKVKKAAQEAASKAKKAAEEAAAKAAEEAKAKKAKEEGARKKAADEAKARKDAEEAAKKAAEEARARKAAEESKAKRAAEEARKAVEEARKKKLEENVKSSDSSNKNIPK